MPTYIQANKKLYRVQPLGTLNDGVELQHSSGWFEIGTDEGKILGNPRWKWFSTDEVLDGPKVKSRKRRFKEREKKTK